MIVLCRDLTHRYRERTALESVSFAVAPGEIFGVLGPNGGGKSTLFRILSTMISPTSGECIVDGNDVTHKPGAVRQSIGVVFQSQSLDRKMTVEENITAQGHLHAMSGAGLRRRVSAVLERVGLEDRRRDLAGSLSGGLRRRLEIAKALLHSPRLLLMDEPSTGLDPAARRDLWDHVSELRRSAGVTVLLTTHILEEADRCDRLMLLHEGRKVAEGTPGELKARVGGDVIVIETSDAGLQREIEMRFDVGVQAAGGTLRIEIPNGHRFLTELVESFPGRIESISVHKPTIEDVFLDETGVRIGD